MRNFTVIFLFLISGLLHGQVVEARYKIMSDDDEVGYLIAKKKDMGDMVRYEISSDISIRILFKIQMTNEIQAVFKDGILQYSSATLYLNGNIYSKTIIRKKDGHYLVVKNDDETKIVSDGIRSSSAKLYWLEPLAEPTSLSETEGEMKEVDLQGVRKYALTENGSSRSVSTYMYSTDNNLDRIELVRPYVPELHIYRSENGSDGKKP